MVTDACVLDYLYSSSPVSKSNSFRRLQYMPELCQASTRREVHAHSYVDRSLTGKTGYHSINHRYHSNESLSRNIFKHSASWLLIVVLRYQFKV